MSDHILVFAEHQDGKLTCPTWEVLAAGQRLGQDLATTVTAVLLGSDISSLASELSAISVQEVLTLDSPLLAQYTADGYALALRALIDQQKPRFVVFSHTYQARDFAPKLAVSLDRGLVSDCLGYRNEGGKLIFVRQVFQGKYCADMEFVGEAPYFVTFQAAAFREDSVQRGTGAATVTPVAVELAPEAIRA
jgi:electron transfer flavoprotein alpha subunit